MLSPVSEFTRKITEPGLVNIDENKACATAVPQGAGQRGARRIGFDDARSRVTAMVATADAPLMHFSAQCFNHGWSGAGRPVRATYAASRVLATFYP